MQILVAFSLMSFKTLFEVEIAKSLVLLIAIEFNISKNYRDLKKFSPLTNINILILFIDISKLRISFVISAEYLLY